ncbi:molybdopterin cofactor-binding domain-containing protein [uncultured Desulfobacter sp.]|uniref:molybdopterin-dependent oxidoreductase n=1 Tax=uncultured Desulfobacter sp. TaxID=240139 RepID=UPI002AA7121C|nr:molybdopterin cofactor-binding domain-containing protein [uncultured Desulfobacter sp.]
MKKIALTINGCEREVIADKNLVLLDLLREQLNLTGTKQSCDRKGQCGACTVIVNKKAVLSCLTKVDKLDGASVISIEGVGTPENPHLIQHAFALSGAIQCGFCTPGMIMAAKALLDTNLNPTIEEIKHALRRNICRCTGYVKIIEAVQLAAQFLRGDKTPEEITPLPTDPKIGVSHSRPSAMIKACGTAAFTSDILMPDAVEIAVVRSPHMHAMIQKIDFSRAEKMPGFIGTLTAEDIKGTNRLKYVVEDRPILCEDRVRTMGDAVAAVVAHTREQALAAAQAVEVQYTLLPEVTTTARAMEPDAPQIHPHTPNLCFSQPLIKGDTDDGFKKAAAVIEQNFTTQLNHQAPLEPENSVAYMEGEGQDAVLVVMGRSINIHLHMATLQTALGYDNIRYEEPFSGGQFGMKLEVFTEGIAAAAALKFKRPVRYIPSLAESMMISSKRHPFDIQLKMGADEKGKLTALEMDIFVDNGAYHSIGNVIINRALQMLTSSYYVPNIKVASKLVYTNNPWGSAARGAGPPQAHYALECGMNMLSRKLNMDPLAFRKQNSLKIGLTKATGHVQDDVWPFPELCDDILPHYERALADAKAHDNTGPVKRGIGLGAAAFGIGFPADKSTSAVELDPDDGVTVYAAAADPGEGNDSMLTQLAAQVLELPLDKVRAVSRTTEKTTAAGPASGSRVTLMVGGATVDALKQLKQAMDEVGSKRFEDFKAAEKPTRYAGNKSTFQTAPLDPETGQGPSTESDTHSIQLAEVEVNTETGEVKVLKMTAVVDAGPVINPNNFTGQMEGGMDMGVGYALREQYIAGKTKDWRTFKFPTMKTAFDMEVFFRETHRKRGTLGSTGVGEMSMVSTAPAVINAIENACGALVTNLPATPDKVLSAIAAARNA